MNSPVFHHAHVPVARLLAGLALVALPGITTDFGSVEELSPREAAAVLPPEAPAPVSSPAAGQADRATAYPIELATIQWIEATVEPRICWRWTQPRLAAAALPAGTTRAGEAGLARWSVIS